MVFWSENHLILYQSSEFLVRQWRGVSGVAEAAFARCRGRVLTFLRQKLRDGFFEFNSNCYILFTLSALLNLVDFASDAEVKSLALEVVHKLLGQLLAFAMPTGCFFSVTGRAYLKHRLCGVGYDVNSVIFLLTGADQCPSPPLASAASFLATSSYEPPLEVLQQFRDPTVSFHVGRDLGTMLRDLQSDSNLADQDFVPFLWSMGAYFVPRVIRETIEFLNLTQRTPGCPSLWEHETFAAVGHLRLLPISVMKFMSRKLKPLTGGSVLTNQRVSLYKDFDHEVLLATVRSKENGMVGYQKTPFIAVLGVASIWTASGDGPRTINGANEIVSHSSLPATRQYANIALLSYRASSALTKFNLDSQVFAHFPTNDFDEFCVAESVNTSMNSDRSGLLRWAFARTKESYLALGSDCLVYKPEAKPQFVAAHEECCWVCVVGSAADFGTFDQFKLLCEQCEAVSTDAVLTVQVPSVLCLDKTTSPDCRSTGEIETRTLQCHWKDGETVNEDDECDDVVNDGSGLAASESIVNGSKPLAVPSYSKSNSSLSAVSICSDDSIDLAERPVDFRAAATEEGVNGSSAKALEVSSQHDHDVEDEVENESALFKMFGSALGGPSKMKLW